MNLWQTIASILALASMIILNGAFGIDGKSAVVGSFIFLVVIWDLDRLWKR